MINRGKQWEKRFEADWRRCYPDGVVIRIPDQMSGFKNSSKNLCDYICFDGTHLYLNECKTITGNTFPATGFTQLEALLPYCDCHNIRAGVIIWYSQHNKVIYVPAKAFKQAIADGLKSININKTDFTRYRILEIPSITKRVFPVCDYSLMSTLGDDYGDCT